MRLGAEKCAALLCPEPGVEGESFPVPEPSGAKDVSFGQQWSVPWGERAPSEPLTLPALRRTTSAKAAAS